MFDNTHVYIDSIGTVHFPISSRSAYLEIDVEFSVGIVAKGDMEPLSKNGLI